MRVRVTLEMDGHQIDETLTGRDAAEIVSLAKGRVAKELGWKGLFLNAMPPLTFAQEAVRRYNAANQTQYALPQSPEEFLDLGHDLGYLQVLPETGDTQ